MIKLTNVSKIYNLGNNNECRSLNNINLVLPNKGFILVKGKSGSGKTTLLNLISNIDNPTSGNIITNYSNDSYSTFVFQDFNLIDYLNIENNLKVFTKNENDYKVLVEKYDLTNTLNKYPNEISGGEKQRLAIIRALLLNKPVLLCDEVTSSLDDDNALLVNEMLKQISKERLVIVVSHDVDLFSNTDYQIELSKGEIVSNNIEINDEDKKIEVEDFNLNLKNTHLISKAFIRKNFAKYVLMSVVLFFSLLLLISSLNGLFKQNSHVIYNVYKNEGISLDVSKKGGYGYRVLSDSELETYCSRYNNCYPFYNHNFYVNFGEYKFKRVYVTNYVGIKLIYGKNDLKDDEIIISDYMAKKINTDLSKVCGTKIGECTIVGIFKTNITKAKEELEMIYAGCYMTKNTLFKKLYSSYDKYNEFEYDFLLNDKLDELGGIIGKETTLKDDEIIISTYFAQMYFNTTEDVVGKNITIDFVNVLDEVNKLYIKESYTFKIVGIEGHVRIIKLSENNYNKIMQKFSTSQHRYLPNGLSFEKYSKNTVKKLINDGFLDNSYLTDEIDSGLSWLKPLNYIELGVGAVLLLIIIVVVINFLNNIFEHEKKTIGIFATYGVKRRKVTNIYFNTFLINFITSILMSLVTEILVIYLINKLIISNGITKVSCLYYEFNACMALILTFVIILGLIYFALLHKIKKRSIIELIYNK